MLVHPNVGTTWLLFPWLFLSSVFCPLWSLLVIFARFFLSVVLFRRSSPLCLDRAVSVLGCPAGAVCVAACRDFRPVDEISRRLPCSATVSVLHCFPPLFVPGCPVSLLPVVLSAVHAAFSSHTTTNPRFCSCRKSCLQLPDCMCRFRRLSFPPSLRMSSDCVSRAGGRKQETRKPEGQGGYCPARAGRDCSECRP